MSSSSEVQTQTASLAMELLNHQAAGAPKLVSQNCSVWEKSVF